jgi:DNA-binding CsgD family transcriptional regulator
LTGTGAVLFGSGDRSAAERAWQELDRLAAESSDPFVSLQALPTRAIRAFIDGDLERVVAQKEMEERLVESLGIEGLSNSLSLLARARALHYLGQATPSLLEDFQGERRVLLACRAFVLSLLNQCEEALTLRARFTGIESDDDPTACMFLGMLLDVSIHCGDKLTAAALTARLSPLANRLDGVVVMSFGRLLGEAATLLDRPDDARGFFEQALVVCARVRCRPELALTRLKFAELLVRCDPADTTRAVELLHLAASEFEAMHMQPSLNKALELRREAELLRPAGRPDRQARRSRPDVDPLTDRERQVATLISQGMSNREIATTLVISESTAEVHVKHVLGKLGLKSRAQVAVWAANRERSSD